MRHSSIHRLAVLIGCCSVLAVPAQGQVLTGSYTGDGTDGRQILGLGPGFVPDVVIVKGDTAQTAVIRTSTMSGDLSKPVSGTALTANLIQSLDSHGFTLGDDARVNSNGVTYHWAAFKVATDRMVVGSYTGTGTAQSVSGFGFGPEYVIVLPADAAEPNSRSSTMSIARQFDADGGNAARITSLDADGFTLGTSPFTNASGVTFHYIAWNEFGAVMDVGSYTGNGVDNTNITTPAFRSEYVITLAATAQEAVHHTGSIGAAVNDSALFAASAHMTNALQALRDDGFQVGTDARVNTSSTTYHYIAWRRTPPQAEVLTGSYSGNATDNRSITGLGFAPDVVLIKGDTTQNAVLRAWTAYGDITLDMITGAPVGNLIQSLDAEGFTIGTDARVNSSGVTYHWVAWQRGAGQMEVGGYTGNATAGRNIIDVGFSPEYVMVFGTTAETVYRNSAASNAHNFVGTANATWITAMGSEGFTVGSDTRVNGSGVTYGFIAWNEVPGIMDVGTYNGDGNDNRSVTGVGFQPEYAFLQRNASGWAALAHPASLGLSTDSTLFFDNRGAFANYIQKLESNGFEVGNQSNVNASGGTYVYAAWARPALTAVRMARMRATRSESGVSIAWRTGFEVDNLGFDVYREIGSQRTRLNPSPLAGSGLLVAPGFEVTAGQTYEWIDDAAEARVDGVRYWIQDLDLNGKRTWHGPIVPERETDDEVKKAPASRPTLAGLIAPSRQPPVRATAPDALSMAAGGAGPRPDARPTPAEPNAALAAGTSRPLSSASSAPGHHAPSVNTSPAQPPARRPAAVVAAKRRGVTVGARRQLPTAALERQWTIASGQAVKVGVRADGWYRIGQPQLAGAGLSTSVDPRMLQLFVDGVEQAIHVDGGGDGRFDAADSIEFFGRGADTPHTDVRVHWIVVGSEPGARLPVTDGRDARVGEALSYPHTVERKERTIFFAALMNGEQENFFGPLVMGGTATDQALVLPDPATGSDADALLEVFLQGVTELPTADDHRVGVAVNGVEVGELVFDGREAGVARFAVPHATLVDGTNVVRLTGRGGSMDMSLLDRLRMTYARAYRARGNELAFTADGGREVTVRGFTSQAIHVIDVTGETASHVVLGAIGQDAGGWTTTFTVPAEGRRTLIAVARDAARAPATVRPNTPSSLHRAGGIGEIVMITHGGFSAALAPLKALRESQGYSVQIVDVEDVYDEFSFGLKTPHAIRDFMIRATEQWGRPPRFALLVGNATTDPRNYYGLGEVDFVPTQFVATGAMEAASDDWFVDADDDGFADLAAIGRLPARTAQQAATMVAKIVGYEQNGQDDAWRRSVVFVADKDDTGQVDYAALNDKARLFVPAGYQVSHVRRGFDLNARAALEAHLNAGAFLVNYHGHGSVGSWHTDLFSSEDVATLTNGSSLPIVIAMNCFNGLFSSLFPEESLAEALVRAPNGGAVGVWASSGMTSSRWQTLMDRELFKQIFQGRWRSIGEAMRAAKQGVGDPDVRRTWIYFGDPAMPLVGVPQPLQPTVTETAATDSPVAAPGGDGTDAPGEDTAIDSRGELRPGVRLVDFDRDGRDDVFLVDPMTGSWSSALGGPGEFVYTSGRFTVAAEPVALDLNRDGKADLFVYDSRSGDWLQALSAGDGRFIVHAGNWQPGHQVAAGDFDGDGREDVFAHDVRDGRWFVALSNGKGGFTYQRGAGLQSGDLHVADFNADGRADVLVYDAAGGGWTQLSSGRAKMTTQSGNWGGGWQVSVAQLDADRRADLVLWHAASGQWVQAFSMDAGRFAYREGASRAGGRVHPLDLNGDGADELLRYDAGTGAWTIIAGGSNGEVTQSEGLWEIGWTLASGDLDADGRDDVLLHNSETGQWMRRLSRLSHWPDEVSGSWFPGWIVAGRRD